MGTSASVLADTAIRLCFAPTALIARYSAPFSSIAGIALTWWMAHPGSSSTPAHISALPQRISRNSFRRPASYPLNSSWRAVHWFRLRGAPASVRFSASHSHPNYDEGKHAVSQGAGSVIHLYGEPV